MLAQAEAPTKAVEAVEMLTRRRGSGFYFLVNGFAIPGPAKSCVLGKKVRDVWAPTLACVPIRYYAYYCPLVTS